MGVDVSHLVLESLGNTDNEVVDQSADSSECGDILAGAVMKLDVDDILLWVGEVDREMVQVLGEFSPRSLDSHKTRLDADLDTLRNSQALFGVDVLHCRPIQVVDWAKVGEELAAGRRKREKSWWVPSPESSLNRARFDLKSICYAFAYQ